MKRSKHTLSHYRLHTGNMGLMIPIGMTPVLPGDTFDHRADCLVRVSPLNSPVMHPVSVRVHHWFVPNRLVWPKDENGGWESFITGGPDGANQADIPTVELEGDWEKSPAAYMGAAPVDGTTINAMPLRAYNLIYNTRYRDQDLIPEKPWEGNTFKRCAWEKDWITTARPWTQKGPNVTVPLGQSAPVAYDGLSGSEPSVFANEYNEDRVLERNLSTDHINLSGSTPNADDLPLYADLSAATGVNVNDFRRSFALQRYQEARARYGSRFTEYLRYLGITPSDARLQEPEFLAGGTSRVNFSEVLQTAPYAEDQGKGVGDLWGHGIAGVRTNRYRKFFEEHGYVITILTVRPKAIYQDHMMREFKKRTKEDYFQKELAHIGQQEVWQSEVTGSQGNLTFGYNDRYYEYKSQFSQVHGDFRSLLATYHLGRDLSDGATLNQEFVACNPSDRIFQVGEDVGDTLWIMTNHHLVARRLVPKSGSSRIF